MAVYVDPLHSIIGDSSPQCFKRAGKACHLFADSLEELHNFAKKVGMKRSWFQCHSMLPHYDLVPSKREIAIGFGAIVLSGQDLLIKWKEIKENQRATTSPGPRNTTRLD